MIASHTVVTMKKGGGNYRPTPEVTVINDELIKQATARYYAENKEEYKVVNIDTLPFNELRVLNLSFQDIYKIQNLEGLNKLEELRLDNNKIKKIENIGHLVHLKWLDLSFNAIEKIEGLDKLTQLQDLSLYSNLIKEVTGLDNCLELNVLSIGNNLIDKYPEMLDYLAKFRKLEVFNVAGNPFTKKELEYDLHIIFKLRHLKYLDYSFIDDAMKNKLEEKDEFKGPLQTRQQEIKQIEEQDKIKRDKADQLKKLKEAKTDTLDNVITEILNDQDYERLKVIKGCENEVQKFIFKFQENGNDLKTEIIKQNEVKVELIKKYLADLDQRINENESETKKNIEVFQKKMKDTFRMFENPDYDNDQELYDLRDATDVLESKLIDIEMQFVQMEDEGIKDFKFKLDDSIAAMIKIVGEAFEKLKGDATKLKTDLNKITNEELDKYQEYTSAENPPDIDKPYTEAEEDLLFNRESVMSIYQQFIENVEGKVFKKETEITEGLTKFVTDFINDLMEKQYERNRRNVNNIISLVIKLKEQIEKQLIQANDRDDDHYSNK